MKKDISLLVGVGGVLAGRALSRQGNTELEIVVWSLSALVAIFFGIYIYRKHHNWIFLLGCILLVVGLLFLYVLQASIGTSQIKLWGFVSGVLFFAFFGLACLITGSHQISPHIISYKQWKYWMLALAGFWLVGCGGAAALIFL